MTDLDREELSSVMHEVADAMEAEAAILSLHPDDGGAPQLLCGADQARISDEQANSFLATIASPHRQHERFHWMTGNVGVSNAALIIPVQRTPGHSSLIVSVFFTNATDKAKRSAEAVYLRRRPFATGYFRLWQLQRTHKRRIEALETALHRTGLGVILLSRDGKIGFANQAADVLLDANDGLCRRHDTISATRTTDNVKLSVAVAVVLDENEDGMASKRSPTMKIPRRELPPLIVSVLPTAYKAHEAAEVAAIVFVLDPAVDAASHLQPLCKLYHLSPVEARLVCLLVSGHSLTEAAGKMRIKEQTARSYLKQIFLKTETNRQTDLVRLILSNVLRTTQEFPAEAF